MMNRFTILVVALLIFAGPRSAVASASASVVFDTVDAMNLGQSSSCNSSGCWTHTTLFVTGILKGQSTPTSRLFDFGDQADIAAHCQRLAMVVMAKPGKYRFGIGTDENFNSVNHGNGACSLSLVTP